MENSTHKVEVFRVGPLQKHPNADTLSIITVFDAYQAVIRTDDFKPGDLACYIPPDNIVPDLPQYEFLKGHRHIKAAKLRGIMSQGLVLAAPAGSAEGDDVAAQLGVIHYVPPVQGAGEFIADPPFGGEHYDIDTWFRYSHLIPDGTPIEVTEKLDGSNTRASFQDGQFWMGSKEHYRKEEHNTLYWRVLVENAWLKTLCEQNPDAVVYGEVYGKVQKTKYAATSNQIYFRVFDIMTPKGYMNHEAKVAAMKNAAGDAWKDCYVPILYTGPYSAKVITDLMNGPSTIPGAKNLREGIVIKPLEEMWSPEIGRLILKAVSPTHLEKS